MPGSDRARPTSSVASALRRRSPLSSSSRFSLLLLEDGEYLLDVRYLAFDVGVFRYLEPRLSTHRKVQGRLKICTRGFFFVPQDIAQPVLRFPFRAMPAEPRAECFVEFAADAPVTSSFVSAAVENMYLTFETALVVEMKERGVDHPYVHRKTASSSTNSSSNSGGDPPAKYIFTPLYSRLEALLATVHVIYEVAKLPRRALTKADEENLLATVLAPRLASAFDASLLVDFREKLLLPAPEPVDRVEPLLKYPGCLMLTTLRVYFQPAQLNNVFDPVLKWEYTEIAHIFKRRHLLRQTGLEIYAASGASFFFAFRSRQARDDTYAAMVDQPGLEHCRREDLELMMRRWQSRELSNFDYLQFLNNAAGRTRNDLTQYPVFPWVLRDYTSATLDLTDPRVFRDLSKPIGALNPERLEYFKTRYEVMPRGDEAEGLPPPFLYGTHYSTPGYVLYFLVRMAPQYMLCLQNGKFDAPDRLFRSIDVSWQGCVTNHADLKELIPEFFDESVPPDEWLCNAQHLDFGATQSLDRVDDVELPPWAHKDPREFVRLNRAALESDYVSSHLHEWIDLIFGYKQQGDEALRADNLFYYLSYEGAVDLETVTDPTERCSLESQIQEFGQTPKLLFSTPHPSRDANSSSSTVEIATPDLLPSPRVGQRRVRRLTYPPPGVARSRNLGRRTVELTSLAFIGDESDDEEQIMKAAPRRSIPSSLSFMCFQAPLERIPRAIPFPSHLWHGIGGGNWKPAKRWNWKEKMKVADRGKPPDWNWVESLTYALHAGEITSAVLSRDDATLYSASKDSSLKASRTTDGAVRRTISCKFALSCCDVTPDERVVLVGCWDNRVYMHSTRTGRELDSVLAHSDGISAICVVGNRFLTSSWDSTVKLWRYTPTFIMANPVQTFTECAESVLCLDTSANGAFGAAGTRNGHVYLFNLATPSFHRDVFASRQRRGDVAAVSFASDSSSFVCITMENELLQFNLDGVQLYSMDMRAPGQVRCFESDGEYAVGGTTNGRMFFWKLHEEPGSELVCEIPGAHDTIISSLAVSVDGSAIVSGAIDGSVRVWRLDATSSGELAAPAEASSMRKTSVPRLLVLPPVSSVETASGDAKSTPKAALAATRRAKRESYVSREFRDLSEYRPLSHFFRPSSMETEADIYFEG
ncbi:hypothetical protein PybrP1_009835 [[Pythium] brassicae (nom. inval.)]|nr:hypothetical protein PybrP1_009835 [[Pythium] brassicae (nom. inval.)]